MSGTTTISGRSKFVFEPLPFLSPAEVQMVFPESGLKFSGASRGIISERLPRRLFQEKMAGLWFGLHSVLPLSCYRKEPVLPLQY